MPKEFGVSNRNVDSQCFRPKVKEAISVEVAFLVSATPTSSRQVANTGWVQAWAPVDEETVARK